MGTKIVSKFSFTLKSVKIQFLCRSSNSVLLYQTRFCQMQKRTQYNSRQHILMRAYRIFVLLFSSDACVPSRKTHTHADAQKIFERNLPPTAYIYIFDKCSIDLAETMLV